MYVNHRFKRYHCDGGVLSGGSSFITGRRVFLFGSHPGCIFLLSPSCLPSSLSLRLRLRLRLPGACSSLLSHHFTLFLLSMKRRYHVLFIITRATLMLANEWLQNCSILSLIGLHAVVIALKWSGWPLRCLAAMSLLVTGIRLAFQLKDTLNEMDVSSPFGYTPIWKYPAWPLYIFVAAAIITSLRMTFQLRDALDQLGVS